MQVEKEKKSKFFSNLNFVKIFYLPPISCRGEVGGFLFYITLGGVDGSNQCNAEFVA